MLPCYGVYHCVAFLVCVLCQPDSFPTSASYISFRNLFMETCSYSYVHACIHNCNYSFNMLATVPLTQIKAFGRWANKPGMQVLRQADPDDKGFTFRLTSHTNNSCDRNTSSSCNPDHGYGLKVFTIIYTVNILLSMVLTIFLLPSIFAAFDTVANKSTFLDDPSQVQLMVIALLASLFMIAIYICNIIHMSGNLLCVPQNYTDNSTVQFSPSHHIWHNQLFVLKFVSSVIIFLLCIVVTNIQYVCCQPRNCLNILKMCGVTLLSAFIFTLIRDIFPAILLLFAFPVDAFALLVLHVALFYTETMVGTLVVCQSRKFWKSFGGKIKKKSKNYGTAIVSSQSTSDEETDPLIISCAEIRRRHPTQNERPHLRSSQFELLNSVAATAVLPRPKPTRFKMKIDNRLILYICRILMFGLGTIAFCGSMIIFYLCMMSFFQLFILRNLDNNTAFSVMIKYVPTAAIGLFGFVIGKSTLFQNNNSDDDGEIFWMKLGELLSIEEEQLHTFDEGKQEKIRNLKRAFKTESSTMN